MQLSRYATFTDEQYSVFIRTYIFPVIAIALFLGFWSMSAQQVQTSLGQLPGPVAVFEQAANLVDEHIAERDKEIGFYQRQEIRNAKKLEKNPDATIKVRAYTGKPTFIDQIFTSLKTVFTGFILASLIAIPIGIITGLVPRLPFYSAV